VPPTGVITVGVRRGMLVAVRVVHFLVPDRMVVQAKFVLNTGAAHWAQHGCSHRTPDGEQDGQQ